MQAIIAIAIALFSTTYGNLTSRSIKALSTEDVSNLREGKGMGLALAAELNSYPGPKHVLELSEALKLTPQQRAAIQESHDRMLAAARSIGEEIVSLERQLDEAFATKRIDGSRLKELTAQIAQRQGGLRYVHLAAHLETSAVLTAAQVQTYNAARGYGAEPQQHHGLHHGHQR